MSADLLISGVQVTEIALKCLHTYKEAALASNNKS